MTKKIIAISLITLAALSTSAPSICMLKQFSTATRGFFFGKIFRPKPNFNKIAFEYFNSDYYVGLIDLIKNKKFDINVYNENGKTLLDLAMEKNNTNLAEFLQKNGAKKSNKKNKQDPFLL